jgi:hypothetical protein
VTDDDIAQVIEGIEEFIIEGHETLRPAWQPYIDKLRALRGTHVPTERTGGAGMKFRTKPVVIAATQWFRNGDHPDDYADDQQGMIDGVQYTITGEYRRARGWEGSVVRYYRRPDDDGERGCEQCGQRMHDHGWIDARADSYNVCPGDWIITDEQGKWYPCKPDIFAATFEPVEDSEVPA